MNPAYEWAVQAGAALSLAATLATLLVAGLAWRRRRKPLDLACALAAAAWTAFLLVSLASFRFPEAFWLVFARYAGYQAVAGLVAFYLLISASLVRFEIHLVWMAQIVLGMALLGWAIWGPVEQQRAFGAWIILNLSVGAALSFFIGANAVRLGGIIQWLVLGGSLMGLGILAQDLLTMGRTVVLGPTLVHYCYAIYLLLLWLMLTGRTKRRGGAMTGESAHLMHLSHSTATEWMSVSPTDFGPPVDAAATAVADERRRIAHDLHDGVGSQLMNILTCLDTQTPQQRAVALAVEQCLLDLKIMVDNIDNSNDSVLDALARLRYRVQHSLDKLGIRMVWKVDVDGPLEGLRGERAQHVLRIAQESLTNAMRHAQPTVIEVVCHYQPDSATMLLEVCDNGKGIPSREAGRVSGKGLEYMQSRAKKLGGQLQLHTRAGKGTRIRLIVPLHAPAARAEPGR